MQPLGLTIKDNEAYLNGHKITDLAKEYKTPLYVMDETTIKNAKAAGIQVGMCGEAAADTKLIPYLIEWGLDEFSVSSGSILQTRKTICEYDK